MRMLLSTTALVMALGVPAIALAQSSDANATTQTQQNGDTQSGFMAERGQADLYASELMGRDVYARRGAGGQADDNGESAQTNDGSQNLAMMTRGDLEEMDSIGQINEIVLSHDGQVRALVIGVGGFLGMAEQDVAVTMDQVTFASDSEDRSETYIIVNTNKEKLMDAPAYDRSAERNASAQSGTQTRTNQNQSASQNNAQATDASRNDNRETFAAPDMEREGYDQVEAAEVSVDMLMGKTVYDVNENDVGDVTDMIVDDDGKITNVIIDFGGFLGIGSSQASLQFDELTILTNEGYEDVRLYVDATKEQIQDLPQYLASN